MNNYQWKYKYLGSKDNISIQGQYVSMNGKPRK